MYNSPISLLKTGDKMSETIKRWLATVVYLSMITLFFWLLWLLLPLIVTYKKPPGEEVKDERVISIVESIKAKAGIHERIKVFAVPGSFATIAGISRGEKSDEVYIVTGKDQLEKWPDEALKGLFAHELAHLSLGHTDLIFKGKRDFEAEADAEAIKLVGRDALWSCLRNYMDDRLDKAEKVLQKESKP